MKKFTVNIWAYDHYAKFNVYAEDNAILLNNQSLTNLGEKSINWEYLGNNYNNEINRITYEEVIDDTRPIQSKKVLGVEVGTGASDNNRYTLEMVRIDDKVKQVITEIKLEEARIAHRQNTLKVLLHKFL